MTSIMLSTLYMGGCLLVISITRQETSLIAWPGQAWRGQAKPEARLGQAQPGQA